MQMSIGSFYPNLLLSGETFFPNIFEFFLLTKTIFSGILWPVEGMPPFLQSIAWYLPCTLACQAMRDVMARGWDIAWPSVYLGYISSVAWIAVFIILSWIVIKIKAN